MIMREIYLDNSATTRMSDGALKKYNEAVNTLLGNPSSLHRAGFLAEREIESARGAIRKSIRAEGAEVIFTASGSEANNLAILGHALSKERYMQKHAKIIITEGEHASVREPAMHLKSLGFEVIEIPTKKGKIDNVSLIAALDERVILVSFMMVNNESGALYDLPSVANLIKKLAPEALFHVDATQSYMKIPFTKGAIGADMITLSSHKIGGPMGVGALVVDSRVIKSHGLSPLVYGGGQGAGLRSGTENLPGILAFAEAVREGTAQINERTSKLYSLRSYLIEKIKASEALSDVDITLPSLHAPHILNITLPKIKSETMLHYLSSEGIYVSSGSACSSHGGESHSALVAYGRSAAEADCSIRISFSHENKDEDVDALVAALESGISRLARIR